MQAVRDALLALGVADERIQREARGPASLRRAVLRGDEPGSALPHHGTEVTFASTGKTAL